MNINIIIFFLLLFFFILALFLWSRKYINPYRLYMVFGKKGSGKTTYLVKHMVNYHIKGWHVFTNLSRDEINTDLMPYVNFIDVKLLGRFVPPPHSVLFLDEVGMIWDNRHYKEFGDHVRDYFKLQRHYKNIVYLASQTFDIDLKLRNLTDAMFLVTSPIPIISVVRRIKRTIVLVQPDGESEGRIADSLEFIPLIMNLFGMNAFKLTFIPRWSKYFNSHEVPPLPQFDYVDIQQKESV